MIFGTFGGKVALFYFLWTFSCAVIAGLTVGRSKVKNHVKNLAEIAAGKTKAKTSACSAQVANVSSSDNSASACCAPIPTLTSTVQFAGTGCCSTLPIDISNLNENNTSCCASAPVGCGHQEKIRGAFQFARVIFRQIIPYVIIGAAISGITMAFVPSGIVEKYVGNDAWYAIPLAAAIGVPLYLRIEMAIPLLSALLVKGMSMGAAMALLIGGTGASLPEIAILSSMLKPKAIVAFVLTVFVIATLGGVLFMFI